VLAAGPAGTVPDLTADPFATDADLTDPDLWFHERPGRSRPG
jgi:hypothetical protein